MTPLQKLLFKITKLQKEIKTQRPFDQGLHRLIQDRLKVEWTYNSNALEGNRLTLGETAFFLQEGLTSEGKPLKDFVEAQNHAEAIDALNIFIQEHNSMSEHFIRSLHQILMKGIDFTYAKGQGGLLVKKPLHIGQYKTQPNHVLTLSGNIHDYTAPEHVKTEMEQLLVWHKSKNNLSVLEKATLFHYKFVRIHPFDDGNGRLARLLMNLILMQEGLPPCIIRNENRKKYLTELESIDESGEIEDFVLFVGEELLHTLRLIHQLVIGKSTAITLASPKLNRDDREELILKILDKKTLAIGQIQEQLPQIKRPTLKKDLQNLVAEKKISRSGIGKGVRYSVSP